MRSFGQGRFWRALFDDLRRGDRSKLATLRRWFRPMPAPYRSRLRMRLRDWLRLQHAEVVFDQCSWMGVRTLKNPLDAWILQEIIVEIRPDVIVEIGSYAGGSTLFYAHVLDALGQGHVVSVDVDRRAFVASHPRIVTVDGDSGSPETLRAVEAHCAGAGAVIVIHDGDHHEASVLRDLEAYAPLVTEGSYFVVEDGLVDLFPPGPDGLPRQIGKSWDGPLAAVDEFLRSHDEFEVDSKRERYVVGYNPRGYLRRASRSGA